MKTVTTVIRCSPFNSMQASEALRMSLGLSLSSNRVRVLFAEDGVYLLGPVSVERIGFSEMERHIRTLLEVGCELWVESESLEARGLSRLNFDVKTAERNEVSRFLAESDLVMSF